MFRRDKPSLTAEPPPHDERPDDLAEELARLRRAVLRQGHAQELFQARVEEAVGRLAAASPPAPSPAAPKELTEAQLRAVMALDQAVLELLRMASGAAAGGAHRAAGPDEDAPASLREGLSLLQVRVRNLARSLGLEPIPAVGRPFDDRRHRAEAVVERPDLPEGRVVEELLPGYALGERVVRPARVVVNRSPGGAT